MSILHPSVCLSLGDFKITCIVNALACIELMCYSHRMQKEDVMVTENCPECIILWKGDTEDGDFFICVAMWISPVTSLLMSRGEAIPIPS